ncbi:MAG: VOC family protein [Rhodomicrobium sp.]|nr:VOC family protein [Rhodomicrobium sp.]
MQLNPYLHFDGRCDEAFKFYEKVLGGKISAMFAFEGSPAAEHVPPEWRGKIMHASLDANGQILMGCDTPPGRYEEPKGFSVTLNVAKVADAERMFEALAENGKVRMPLEQTFWAARFGMVTDRFGIPWMINCEKDV